MPIVLRSSIPDEAKATENLGKRAEAHVGEINGSGAGAGGSGEPEDYVSDPPGGGGTFPAADALSAGKGADAPSHGSR